jgi:nucleoside-diphosphate-sugar epimerase
MNGEKKSNVLITGGSGLIGKYLSSLLLERGYNVAHLSRKQDQFGVIRVHRWDPEKGVLDPVAQTPTISSWLTIHILSGS